MATNERAILGNLNRRARFYGGESAPQLTEDDIFGILAFYNRRSCKSGEPGFSFDHVKPLKLGGENVPENIQLLTEDENKAKRDAEIDYRQGKICTRDWLEQWKQDKTNAKGRGDSPGALDLDDSDQRRDKRTKHDWDALEFEYTTTDISLRELAEKHGIFPTLLFKRSAAEHWTKAREQFGSSLVAEVTQEVKQIAKAEGISAIMETARVLRSAIDRWEFDGNKAKLGEIIDGLKLLAAMQGETTERHNVNVSEQPDDAAILARINSAFDAGEEEGIGSSLGLAGDEPSAGWTD